MEYCLIQWDGFRWNIIEDHCSTGKHCQIPEAGGMPFEYDIVDCVS